MTKYKYILGSSVFLFLFALAVVIGYNLAFRKLIFPRVKIANIEVTGMNKESALRLVKTYFETNPSFVILVTEGTEVSKLEGLKVEQDPVWAVDQALSVGRNGNILTQMAEQIRTL